MKPLIWVLALNENEAAEWAQSQRLPESEWRYAENEEHLKLAVKGDRFHWSRRVRERPDYFLIAGVVRAKKMEWWKS
ncbi:MAG TPA: hypothetical protein VGH72_33890 [Pseudonocardia sp.]|jgi:hypothetical protein